MGALTAKANEKLYGESKKKNEEFIKNMAKQPGVKPLAGGVYYKELTPGTVLSPPRIKSQKYHTEVASWAVRVFDFLERQNHRVPRRWCHSRFHDRTLEHEVGAEWIVYIPWNQATRTRKRPHPSLLGFDLQGEARGCEERTRRSPNGRTDARGTGNARTSSAIKRCNDPLFGTIAQL